MRTLVIGLVLAAAAFGQRGGMSGARGMGHFSTHPMVSRPSGGGMMRPGGGYRGPVSTPGVYRRPGYGVGYGYYRGSGFYGGLGFRYGGYRYSGIWPGYFGYSTPYWGWGGFGYAGYDPYYTYPYSSGYYEPYGASPGVVVINGAAAPVAAPPTVIYQTVGPAPATVGPRVAEDRGEEAESRPAEPARAETGPARSPIYLIALQDGSIRAAEAYWVEGATLHYVTRQHERKQVPVAQIDRRFTEQLNRERRVEFQLPKP